MIDVIATILMPFSLLGLLMAWHVLRPQKSPADKSNRINKIRIIWFSMTREDLFVDTFPWLKRDEYDNVKGGCRNGCSECSKSS